MRKAEAEGEEEAFAVDEFAAGLDAPAAAAFPAAAEGDYKAPGEFKVPLPPKFEWINAAPGLILVGLGFVISLVLSIAVFGDRRNALSSLKGLTQRSRIAGGIHAFLRNKLKPRRPHRMNRMKPELLDDTRRLMSEPNAGGSSINSEAISVEMLGVSFAGKLELTEMEVEYTERCSIADYVASVPLNLAVPDGSV